VAHELFPKKLNPGSRPGTEMECPTPFSFILPLMGVVVAQPSAAGAQANLRFKYEFT